MEPVKCGFLCVGGQVSLILQQRWVPVAMEGEEDPLTPWLWSAEWAGGLKARPGEERSLGSGEMAVAEVSL